MSKITLTDEGSTPANPPLGTAVVYAQAGVLYVLGPSGTPSSLSKPPTFVAGPVGSNAPYKGTGVAGIAAAISAASAAGGGVVQVLPGSYVGASLTLPENVSLTTSAGFGSVILQTNITCTSAAGNQALAGFYVQGTLTCDAGATSSAQLFILDCAFNPNTGVISPITVVDDGWSLDLNGCTFNSSSLVGVNGITLAADPSGTGIEAKNCAFNVEATANSISGSLSGGSFEGCTFNRPIEVTTSLTATLNLNNTLFNFDVTAPNAVVDFTQVSGGTLALNVLGSFGISGLAVAGTLFSGAGATAYVGTPSTFLGTYQTANLPPLTGGSPDGCLAYSSNGNALYVRRSGAWEKVASQSNSNTWNASGGQQTFYTTQFNRAAIPDAVNGGASYALTDTSAPLVRMETAGGAKTVTLFSPGVGDVGKQWVVFDAARDASGAGPITISLLVGTDTLNGTPAGTATISTDGGALVFRVTAANAWETIGY
jgi:hypothetical protein